MWERSPFLWVDLEEPALFTKFHTNKKQEMHLDTIT